MFYGKQEWICGDVILAPSWFDLITSSVITAEWAPRDKQIRSSINYLLAAASSVTLWENFVAWRGEWTYVIPHPWNHTLELEELCVLVWLKFSDLTLHLSGEGDWGRTWTRGAQLTFFCFTAPFHPWPSVVSPNRSTAVGQIREPVWHHHLQVDSQPCRRLSPARVTASRGCGRVELGGVWTCVWMDLMCKHWPSVIWWHMKGCLPVGLPGRRRLYVDPPHTHCIHWHQIYVFMHCGGAAQRNMAGGGWGRVEGEGRCLVCRQRRMGWWGGWKGGI